MGFGDFVKNQFIDVIEYVDTSFSKTLVVKYSRPGNEIKQGAQLIVRNGQAAVFVHRGQIADIFGPGNYKLNTGNLPLLSALAAVPYLFNSPIKSDLYFINTTQFINNNWGTTSPILKRDSEMGMVRINANGKFAFRVSNPVVFMNEVFGSRNLSITREIVQYLVSFVGESIAQCIGECSSSVLDLATNFRQLSSMLVPYVNEKTQSLGITITQASIESIALPKEVEKLIDEQSGIGLASRDMDTFIQYQSARAIRDAAKQKGGLAGLGAGAVVGRTVAKSMADSLDRPSGRKKQEPAEEKMVKKEPAKENPVNAGDIADKIGKYKKLLDEGVLTQEEFDEVKAMLLKEI